MFKKGEPADKFYFVLSGQILIKRTDGLQEDFSLVDTHKFMAY